MILLGGIVVGDECRDGTSRHSVPRGVVTFSWADGDSGRGGGFMNHIVDRRHRHSLWRVPVRFGKYQFRLVDRHLSLVFARERHFHVFAVFRRTTGFYSIERRGASLRQRTFCYAMPLILPNVTSFEIGSWSASGSL